MTWLEALARQLAQSGLSESALDAALTPYLERLKAGRKLPDPPLLRRLLHRGLGLDRATTRRLLLDERLYAAGIRDGELRQLLIDVVHETAPPELRRELRRLYRSHSSEE